MNPDFFEFVHLQHIDLFIEAARSYRCHILVRKTGRAALHYVGRPGYVGKMANMKAKTATYDSGRYKTAGLVCWPRIHPGACKKKNAAGHWQESAYLIAIPERGFSDDVHPRCGKPYIVQTDPDHRHYGCIAFVDGGLTPHYVHGDYDLHAIFAAGRAPGPTHPAFQKLPMVANPSPTLPLEQRVRVQARAPQDLVGPLAFNVTNFLNIKIAQRIGRRILGGLMINHGEFLNHDRNDFEEVLAFMPEPQGGEYAKILRGQQEHEDFYRNA